MRRLILIQVLVLTAACSLTPTAGYAQAVQPTTLDETWTLSVAGQVVRVNPDGSFRIPNISAPDQFGPGGPGTRPDFLSDDFVRLVGFSTAGGTTRYVFSDPFQLRQRETVLISELTLTFSPPPFPDSIRAAPDLPTLTAIGQSTQVRVLGTLVDGTTIDVTPRSLWTVYRTSNGKVGSVDGDGRVTAVGPGTVFITAINEGATAVAQIVVSPGDPLTTVTGIVRDATGRPVEGVTITLLGASGTAVTGADGAFRMPGVAAAVAIQGALARTTDAAMWFGLSSGLKTVRGGLTDAGVVRVTRCAELGIADCEDTDGDCLPNSVETTLRLDPIRPDSDNDGILDGEEDTDGDGLPNCAEVAGGTNPGRSDTDGDGLTDGAESLTHGTDPRRVDTDGDVLSDGREIALGLDPLRDDTDGDGWNDEAETTAGSHPGRFDSRPPLFVASARDVGVGLVQSGSSAEGKFGVTMASPAVSMVASRFPRGGEFPVGTIVSLPSVSIGLPSFGGVVTPLNALVAHPIVYVALPAFRAGGDAGASGQIAQPPVSVGFGSE
jgi:hypothetical protein